MAEGTSRKQTKKKYTRKKIRNLSKQLWNRGKSKSKQKVTRKYTKEYQSETKNKTNGKRQSKTKGGANKSINARMNSNNRNSNIYPVYSRKKWNKNKMVKRGHNCYTYFLDKISKKVIQDCREKHGLSKYDTKQTRSRKIRKRKPCGKPQPGYYAGMERYPKNETSCEHLHKRIIADNPDIYPVDYNGKTLPTQMCNNDEYAGALVVHPKKTYHFYRQDGDGSWSHKPGSLQTTKNDASGKPITNPKYANRTYTNFDYSDFCSFYCIPKDIRKRNYSLRRQEINDE
jgi:hypothetical protein